MVNDAVVAAMRDVIPVFVNIDNDPKKICDEFRVTLRPTLVLADQEGQVLKKYEGEPQVPNLQQIVPEFAKKYFRDFPWAESLDKAIEAAKADKKRVAVYFAEESDASRQFVKTLKDASLKDLAARYVFAKFTFKKGSDEAKKYNAAKPLTLIVLNPEDGAELDRVEGKKTAKELKALFEKNVRKD